MSKQFIEIEKIALSAFIEDCIQSPTGPSESDMEYIRAERERIARLEQAAA